MAGADVGIVPKRADSFGNEAYSTKIMEFMALGVPVVASETRIDRYYFSDDVLRFFRSGDPEALAEAVVDVLENMEETQRRVDRALAYARAESWEVKKHEYLALVSRLCGCAEPLPVADDPGQSPPGGAQSPVPALSRTASTPSFP
jgi:glycosyltransferase involved in cell wall biosynthesis